MSGDPFRGLADRFIDHYGTLRGAVRHALVARALEHHMDPSAGSVLDIGGGRGDQAAWLATRGHRVTVLDPSNTMLAQARAYLPSGVELILGRGEEAQQLLPGRSFEAVLCHAVLPYIDDPRPLLEACASMVRSGGLVSIVAKNADALAMRPGLEGRWAEVPSAFDATGDVGGMGVATKAHRVSDLIGTLDLLGIEHVAWYGIRLFTDHFGGQPVPPDAEDIIEAEWQAGCRDPYRGVARLVHVVGRRR